IDVLSLQADRGECVAVAHRPPLQAITTASLVFFAAAGPGGQSDPVFRHDTVPIGCAAVKYHLSEARIVPQRCIESGATEFAADSGRAVHDVEAVRFRAQRFPQAAFRVSSHAHAGAAFHQPSEYSGIDSLVLKEFAGRMNAFERACY